MNLPCRTLLLALLVCLTAPAPAQRRNALYNDYIKQYAPLAITQMQKYRVPASITLAQGLLESGAGRSSLAKESNNHFGIKCHTDWKGRRTYYDDDSKNDCFRVYSDVKDSYEDHSRFLRSGARYAFLFDLSITDYRGWAKGLKRAGYATDPGYANRLIGIIETYELYKYDKEGMSRREQRRWERTLRKKPWLANPHQVYVANDLAYVIAREGDNFHLLEGEFDISASRLAKYNEVDKHYSLQAGDIIYLAKKNKKAAERYTTHTVKAGDSMYSISQKYGIRLKNLYRMNKKSAEYAPQVGDKLRLR